MARERASDAPVEARPVVESKEAGVSGTANWNGYLQTENNPALAREAGYGRLQTWGQYEELRRTNADATVAMEMTVAPIRDASLEVEPVDDSEEAAKMAGYVHDNLLHWMAPKWGGVSEQIVDTFLTYGFDIHETVHGVRDDDRVPGGKAYFVRRLAHRLPASLSPNPWVEKDGELVAVRQQGYRNGEFVNVELPVEKLLLFTWKQNGTNWAGYSAFRAAWYLWRIQKECIKAFGIGTSRESLGIPVVTNEGEGDDKKIEALRKFVANLVMHENASVVLPKGFELNWLFSPGANKSHIMDGIDRLGSKIKELLFAHGTGLGITSEGNRSVGETHEDIRGLFICGLIRVLTDVVNGVEGEKHTGLVRRIVDPNWGPQPRYPLVKLVLKKGDIPVDKFATGVSQMIAAGAITWTEQDESHTRERFGLGVIDPKVRKEMRSATTPVDGEEIADPAEALPGAAPAGKAGAAKVQDTALNGAQVTALLEIVAAVVEGRLPRASAIAMIVSAFNVEAARAEAMLGEVGKSFVPTERTESAPVDEPSEEPRKTKASALDGFIPRRAPRRSERFLAAAEIDGYINRAREDFERDTKDIAEDMVRRALPQVKRALADGDPSDISEVKLDKAGVASYVAGFVEKARRYGAKTVRTERKRALAEQLLELRRAGDQTFAPTPLAAAAEEEEEDDRLPVDSIDRHNVADRVEKVVKAQTNLVTNRIVNRVQMELEREAIDLVSRGGEVETIVDRVVDGLLESKVLRNDAGLVLTRSFNLGREEAAAEFGDDIEEVERSALLDGNECAVCRAKDGQTADFGSARHDELMAPEKDCDGGANCRCLVVYRFKAPAPRKGAA